MYKETRHTFRRFENHMYIYTIAINLIMRATFKIPQY